eukprot:scaffold324849_cov57-Tisochrysis_lutea.AAC.1
MRRSCTGSGGPRWVPTFKRHYSRRCSVDLTPYDMRAPACCTPHLGLPLHYLADSLSKEGLDVLEAQLSVLDSVMKQAGDDRLLVHLRLCEDPRHLDWVRDVRFSRTAVLSKVGEEGSLERHAQRGLRRRPEVSCHLSQLPVKVLEEPEGRRARGG